MNSSKHADALEHEPHMLPFETCPHKIGDLIMVPGNPPTDRINTTFHTVTDIATERGHLLLTLKQWSTIHLPRHLAMETHTHRIRGLQGEVWVESHSTPPPLNRIRWCLFHLSTYHPHGPGRLLRGKMGRLARSRNQSSPPSGTRIPLPPTIPPTGVSLQMNTYTTASTTSPLEYSTNLTIFSGTQTLLR
jgi:hypothetical protein